MSAFELFVAVIDSSGFGLLCPAGPERCAGATMRNRVIAVSVFTVLTVVLLILWTNRSSPAGADRDEAALPGGHESAWNSNANSGESGVGPPPSVLAPGPDRGRGEGATGGADSAGQDGQDGRVARGGATGPVVVLEPEGRFQPLGSIPLLASLFTELDPARREGAYLADLTADGELDLFDILEFHDLLSAGDPRADFSGDGVLDHIDIIAFQSEMAAGTREPAPRDVQVLTVVDQFGMPVDFHTATEIRGHIEILLQATN
jgi:hypothetical protein